MLKKTILIFLISIFCLFGFNNISADSIPVEDIFSDINEDYKYLDELQALYNNGMIKPDVNGRFNPLELLNRDEFVGILMEVSCEDCIQPNTSLDLIKEYENKQSFFDVNKINKYYYCVEDASEQGFVKGYHPGTVCDNGVSKEGEIPYCPENTIILEEAIAVLLRASGILTNEEAEKVRQNIYNGIVTEVLSEDVSPKNIDGSVYSFYPDFQKALEYEIIEVDTDGNVVISTLLEVIEGKLRPKQAVSKEDFLRIAYLTLKANSCDDRAYNDLALKIIINDKSCDINDKSCELSDLDNLDNEFDFTLETYTTCKEGISNPEGYIWRFYNEDTGEEIKKYGKYIDNYKFGSNGTWNVFLRVIDNCGLTSEIYTTINIDTYPEDNNEDSNDLNVVIDVDPIQGKGPLLVNFSGIVTGGEGSYTYYWDFGNGNNGFGKNIKNIFKEEGNYEVILLVTDSEGNTALSTVLIKIEEDNNIAIRIIINNNECTINDKNCELSDLEDEDNKFDFGSEVYTTCESGISDPYGYIWRFFNQDTGEEIIKYGKYIDDHEFLSSGMRIIYLKVVDNCGITGEVFNSIGVNINMENDVDPENDINTDLKATIYADPINGSGPLSINFEGIVSGGEGIYEYYWDFGDGTSGIGNEVENIFIEEGNYLVNLLVTDSEGNSVNATIVINTMGSNNCSIDSDNDGVNDCDDLCPLIKGDIKNKGCPIYDDSCDDNSDCTNGNYCTNDTKVCLPKLLKNSCEYSGGDVIFGNIICNTCPCDNYLDFISTLRECDVIFPAITSRDSKTIYSKGELFNIGE